VNLNRRLTVTKRIALTLAVLASLLLPAAAAAHITLYGSPGPEQEQLQAWANTSRAPTPNVGVRLYEGNCEEGRPEGHSPEPREGEGGELQTCAALTTPGATPTARNQAIYIPHMAWHPQMAAWWWHLNLLNEPGHVYDYVIGDRDHHRERFAAIYGYDPAAWFPVNMWAAMNSEYEKWSMAYAFCGYGMTYAEAHVLIASEQYSGFGFDPGASEYRRTCTLVDRLPGARPTTRRKP